MDNFCKNCGNKLNQNVGRGRKKVFCSSTCLDKYRYKTGLKKSASNCNKKTFTTNICLCCKKEFKTYGRKSHKYCSVQCVVKSRVRLTSKVCIACGAVFKPRTSRQIICGKSCLSAYQKMIKPKKTYTCAHCKKTYTISHSHKTIYCSKECSFLAQGKELNTKKRRSNWRLGQTSDRHHRLKARQLGVNYERMNPVEIFKRDNWVCWICGKKVDQSLRYPNKECASLDHLIPMSKGGTHTACNVKLAHLRCNVEKKDKFIPYQLELTI